MTVLTGAFCIDWMWL